MVLKDKENWEVVDGMEVKFIFVVIMVIISRDVIVVSGVVDEVVVKWMRNDRKVFITICLYLKDI